MSGNEEAWELAQQKANRENNWFTPAFIHLSVKNIAEEFLQSEKLEQLAGQYAIGMENPQPKKIGIVMAGNIPLVGFHDLICVFLSGHYAMVKPSSKDEVLISHLVSKLHEWDSDSIPYITLSPMIRNCDAYIATGSNNSSRYFEYYFQKYPSIIRRNRTSVALLDGTESTGELEALADDVYQFFGLGCRNVTKLYVPEGYAFIPLLDAFRKYDELIHHHKYKNNYDYNLAVHILNNQYYMTNGSMILVENPSLFSPIAQLHYQFYASLETVEKELAGNENIQLIVGHGHMPFGQAQCPGLLDYADGVDTMHFLQTVS